MTKYKTYVGRIVVKAAPMTEMEWLGTSKHLEALGFKNINIVDVEGYEIIPEKGPRSWREKKYFDKHFKEEKEL